jgi:hypothetical protein
MGAIDEGLCQVELAAITEILREATKHALQCFVLDP